MSPWCMFKKTSHLQEHALKVDIYDSQSLGILGQVVGWKEANGIPFVKLVGTVRWDGILIASPAGKGNGSTTTALVGKFNEQLLD